MDAAPSPNGGNGRSSNGRFAKGNTGGPGNPFARKAAELRSALMDAVTPQDMQEIVRTLMSQAKAGSVPAIRELLERTLGKPVEFDLIQRLEALEDQLQKLQQQKEVTR